MSDNKTVTTGKETTDPRAEATRTIRPAVDIIEDTSEIQIRADLPGVAPERLDIHVEGNTLTIEGQARIDMPEGMEALHADLAASRFRRSFTLSGEIDTAGIRAEMRNGELTLHLPKRSELQPRKIEVAAG